MSEKKLKELNESIKNNNDIKKEILSMFKFILGLFFISMIIVLSISIFRGL